MMKTKPYKATSLRSAEREVRHLRKQVAQFIALWEEAHADRVAFAKLAADGLAFDDHEVRYKALLRRNEILAKWCRLNADGKPLERT